MNGTLTEREKIEFKGVTEYTWWQDGTRYVSDRGLTVSATMPTLRMLANISCLVQGLKS